MLAVELPTVIATDVVAFGELASAFDNTVEEMELVRLNSGFTDHEGMKEEFVA